MTTPLTGTSPIPRITRRRWLILASATAGVVAAACGGSTPAAKPTEAPKPAEAPKPTTAPAAAASPAAGASPAAAAASPAASPAAGASPSAGASPAASPAAQAAPTGGAATAKPSSTVAASMVTNWFGQSSQGGFFAARKNGRYKDQNLDMTVDQGGPQVTPIPLLASGKYTFAMTSAEQVLLGRAEGVPLVMVYGTFQRNPQGLMYHASHPVKDFPDLNGRKVYVSGAGTFWQVLTKKYNLDNVQQFQYNGQLATFLADEENVFQCFVTSEPVILKSQGKDVGYLVNADSGFNPYQNAMVTLEKTIKEQPDLVQAYVTASLQGWNDYVKEPKPVLEFIKSDYAKELNLDTEMLTFASERDGFLTGKDGFDAKKLGLLDDARFKDLYDLIRGLGVLTKDIDYKAAFDSSFITKAHAALGM